MSESDVPKFFLETPEEEEERKRQVVPVGIVDAANVFGSALCTCRKSLLPIDAYYLFVV